MGTGYTRNDTGNNIATGKTIAAADLDGEFEAIEDAFEAATGHTHDGTASEGAPITVTGPAQEYVSDGTALYPKTDNTYDLGKATFQWKDLYIDGTANIDSLVADTADINGGTIDGTIIGGTTAAVVSFTDANGDNLDLTTDMTVGGTVTVTGDVVVDTDTLFVDVSEDRVGVNNVSPTTALDVTGTGTFTDINVSDTDTTLTNLGVGIETLSDTTLGADVSSVDFNNTIVDTSKYNMLLFVITGLDHTGSNGAADSFGLRFSDDNGSTFISTLSYDYEILFNTSSVGGSEDFAQIATAIEANGDAFNNSFLIWLTEMDTDKPQVQAFGSYHDDAVARAVFNSWAGLRTGSVTSINAVRFLFETNNIEAGTRFQVYGYRSA